MQARTALRFSEESPAGEALYAWWRSLEEARGDRAHLRRCPGLVEVVFVPAYHRLRHALLRTGPVHNERLATLAGLLAHVKSHNGSRPFAAQMARPKRAGGAAGVSGLRFRRLLQCRSHDELYLRLIRAVRLLDGEVNLYSLASAAYWWNDRTRKQWAYEYYAAAPSEE